MKLLKVLLKFLKIKAQEKIANYKDLSKLYVPVLGTIKDVVSSVGLVVVFRGILKGVSGIISTRVVIGIDVVTTVVSPSKDKNITRIILFRWVNTCCNN